MEVTKWLKPSISGSRIGDRASVQAATRVNAEQASHDEGWVKGSHYGNIETSPVASVSKVQALCTTRPVSEHGQPHIRSLLITAAPRSRFRRAGLRKTRTILESGISGHGLLRFVCLDPPGLIRSWEMTGLRRYIGQATFIVTPSITTPAVTYFQSATSSFRASATMVVLRSRPPLRLTRS
jgi:hypothetical protein